jgi:hypothetical protein
MSKTKNKPGIHHFNRICNEMDYYKRVGMGKWRIHRIYPTSS